MDINNYKHVIITRFSFRFNEDDDPSKILNTRRLEQRIKIWSEICFPSVCQQKCKDFYWIIIVDPLLPLESKIHMEKIIQSHYDSETYLKMGPRKIWLHPWNYSTNRLHKIDWILEYFGNWNRVDGPEKEYLITTRLDDDDAINQNMVAKIRAFYLQELEKAGERGFHLRYISYLNGIYFNIDNHHIMKKKVRMIAIGLTLISRINTYPITVYLGSHTKIPLHLRHPEFLPEFNKYYKANKHFPGSDSARKRLKVISTNEPMWIRTIHNHNLQHNIHRIPKGIGEKSTSEQNLTFLKQYFGLNLIPLSSKENIRIRAKTQTKREKKLSKPRIVYLKK